MDRQTYKKIELYMKTCMKDVAHDIEHIYRVLFFALDIGETFSSINYDILIAACLLHDIGRKEQFEHPQVCHAQVGGEKAYKFLLELGWQVPDALAVKECIVSHRFRSSVRPQSNEAKALFDADKLDATGCIGISRSLIYKGIVGEPLYTKSGGELDIGSLADPESFFKEYNIKLKNLYSNFYTKRGMDIALHRQRAAVDFFSELNEEVESAYENSERLDRVLE